MSGRQDYDDDAAMQELLGLSQDVPGDEEIPPPDPVEEPPQEEVVEEPQADEPAEEQEQVQYATKDDFAVFQSQVELFNANLARMLDERFKSLQQQPAPQPVQQKPQPSLQEQYPGYADDPAFQHIERLTKANQELEGKLAQFANSQHQHSANFAWQNVEAGRNNLRSRYSDFDQVIKPEEVEQLWRAQVNQRNYHAPFAQVMEREYKLRTWDNYQKASDELSKRREEKVSKSASVAAAAKVPTGGASFQKVEHKLDPAKRGYDDVHAAAMADIEAMGG